MIGWIALSLAIAIVVGALAYVIWIWKFPPRLNTEYFSSRWRELQNLLKYKDRWDVAVTEADNLLGAALRKRRFRGNSQGERMVKAQRLFTDNDAMWFGHKLRGKIEAEPEYKLKQSEVKQALMGIRQALKDLGALKK